MPNIQKIMDVSPLTDTDTNSNGSSFFFSDTNDLPKLTSNLNGTNTVKDSTELCPTPYCILNTIVISIISVSGIISNLIVMVVVKIDKRLHQPTFVAIAALALPDFMFLVARYTRYIIDKYFSTSMSTFDFKITKICFDLIGLIAGGASIFHVVLLSVLRYFIVVHPLKMHVVLTINVVMFISFALWIVAAGNGSFYLYAVVINQTDRNLARTTNRVVTIFMSVFPVVVIGVLHVLKKRTLLNSLSVTEETIRKMSRVITFVICSYLITTTPSNLLDIARLAIPTEYVNTKWFYGLSQAGRVFLFLNYAINPFIYFMFSPPFKRFFSENWSVTGTAVKRSFDSQMVSETYSLPSTHLTEIGAVQKTYQSTKATENNAESIDET